MGLPVIIVNDKYERQKIQFNLAVIVPPEEGRKLTVYEDITRKLAYYLTTLELEDELLSVPGKQLKLANICQEIYRQLNDTGKCYLQIDPWNMVALEYQEETTREPRQICSWDVPIPLQGFAEEAEQISQITMKKIYPLVNGIRHVRQIASEAKLLEASVKQCLQHLYYYNLVDIVDIYQSSNVYRVTERLLLLLTELAEESVLVLSKSEEIDEIQLLELYYDLSDVPVAEFMEKFPNIQQSVNLDKFIPFGIIHGLIQRVHQYFVLQTKMVYTRSSSVISDANDRQITSMLNGNHSLDEICCTFDFSTYHFKQIYGKSAESFFK